MVEKLRRRGEGGEKEDEMKEQQERNVRRARIGANKRIVGAEAKQRDRR